MVVDRDQDSVASLGRGGQILVVFTRCLKKAGIAQLVEQLICNQQVIGSNPIAGSGVTLSPSVGCGDLDVWVCSAADVYRSGNDAGNAAMLAPERAYR